MDSRVVSYNGNYGYVYTGPGPNGCSQYHNLISLDGPTFQTPGMQNGGFPCVYYTPGYDYAQSHYNPYNLYVPGAVIGTDTQLMGVQQMQIVPHFGYTPVMDQSRSDAIQNSHPDALNLNNGAGYSSAYNNGSIVLNRNEYNKADFSVEYPNAKFFVIKSYSEDDVHKSIKYNVWSSTICGNKKLDKAYREAPRKCPVFLFFSVNASGHFCGVAEMMGPVNFDKDMEFWLQDKWRGCFPVKWHIIKDVTNYSFRHIILENNEGRPVTSSRDTQEVPYLPGINMLTIFKGSPLKTCILDDFSYYEERQQRMMRHEENSVKCTESNEVVESTEQFANDDVLTVGSMQIIITDENRFISGVLTIGSFPDDDKRSKT